MTEVEMSCYDIQYKDSDCEQYRLHIMEKGEVKVSLLRVEANAMIVYSQN